MLTWITVWILTVSHYEVDSIGHGGYGVGYTYQLQYKDQKTCLKQADAHRERKTSKTKFLEPDSYVNKHKRTRCDFQQIPVYK